MGFLTSSTFRRRLVIKLAWAIGVAAVIGLSVTPQDSLPEHGDINDKVAHLLAYLGVTMVGVFAASNTTRRRVVVIGMIALGVVLEFAQLYVPGRHFEFLDAVANGAGAILALLVYNVLGGQRSNGL